jgi:DNA (cytosine-5)-methyltransferase 1
VADYTQVKVKVWGFIEKFRGKGFGMGDARAYVSLLADLKVAEGEKDYAEALYAAYEEALFLYRSGGPSALAEDYGAKVKEWAALDRSSLSARPPPPQGPGLRPVVEGATVVSLFTGAYGLDLGFERAGYEVVLGLDVSDASYRNFRANRPKTPFIHGDIAGYSTADILKEAGLGPGEVGVVTGGPHPEVVYAVTTSDGKTERFDTLSGAIDHLIELLERPPEVARLLMRLSVLGDVKVVNP